MTKRSAGILLYRLRGGLEVLSEAGLVTSVREGRERIWALEPTRLADAHAYLDRISRQWDDALARLQAFVEIDHP